MIEKEKPLKIEIRCELCSYKSNRKSNFDRHMKSMHEECQHPFQCCGKVFINKATLKSHCRETHKNGYRCDYNDCKKLFPRKALLRRHQTVHNGIKEFSCAKCTYETSHKSNLERHCLRVHNLLTGNLKSNKPKKKVCFQTLNNANQQSSQSSSNNSFSETDEFSSSQEMVSSQESLCRKLEPIYINDENLDHSSVEKNHEIKFESQLETELLENENVITSENMNDISFKDEELKTVNKRLRLCLRPYKCLICWLLFESQLEYFEHQLLSDHFVEENSDELEVMRAAIVLTQLKRSSNQPIFTF